MLPNPPRNQLAPVLGSRGVVVAGLALVVASSTAVSEFVGLVHLGPSFGIALLLALGVHGLGILSALELAMTHPRAGGLFHWCSERWLASAGSPAQVLATTLGLAWFAAVGVAAAGETHSGAQALQVWLGGQGPAWVFVLGMHMVAMLAALFGLRVAVGLAGALLLPAVGIRLAFGILGFAGLGDTGGWAFDHLLTEGGAPDMSEVLRLGLPLALWSFLGLEIVAALVEEVRFPRASLSNGLPLVLLGVLVVAVVSTVGVVGTAPLATWERAILGPMGQGGEAPQLAVAQLVFGKAGLDWMAASCAAATLGSLVILYAALPRVLLAMGREGVLGPLSGPLARLDPRFRTPVFATCATFCVYIGPALGAVRTLDWIASASYLWFALYGALHGLLFWRQGVLRRRSILGAWRLPVAWTGLLTTPLVLSLAFHDQHQRYGGRALLLVAAAFGVALVSRRYRSRLALRPTPVPIPERISDTSWGWPMIDFDEEETIELPGRRAPRFAPRR